MSGSGKNHVDIVQERKGKISTVCYEVVDKQVAPECLTLKFRGGIVEVLPYRLMMRATRSEATHLEISFAHLSVLIEGEGLEPILAGLSDARVTYIAEAPAGHRPQLGKTHVKTILVESE